MSLPETPTERRIRDALARAVRRLRADRGWTQENAAHACKLSLRVYQQVESGTTSARLSTLAQLADGFGVEPDALLSRPRRKARPLPI